MHRAVTLTPRIHASMKVPTRRRGNHLASGSLSTTRCLNESPRPKAGKSIPSLPRIPRGVTSMKVPARRWGNCQPHQQNARVTAASMKVPPECRNKSIPKQPFKHLNTIDKPKHHASDTPTLRHVPGSRGDRPSLQRPLSPPLLPVRNRTRHSPSPATRR